VVGSWPLWDPEIGVLFFSCWLFLGLLSGAGLCACRFLSAHKRATDHPPVVVLGSAPSSLFSTPTLEQESHLARSNGTSRVSYSSIHFQYSSSCQTLENCKVRLVSCMSIQRTKPGEMKRFKSLKASILQIVSVLFYSPL
jgi:hypothetical protein